LPDLIVKSKIEIATAKLYAFTKSITWDSPEQKQSIIRILDKIQYDPITDEEKVKLLNIINDFYRSALDAKYYNNWLIILKDSLLGTGAELIGNIVKLSQQTGNLLIDLPNRLLTILNFLTKPQLLIAIILIIVVFVIFTRLK
jgi:hypothetical protein